MRKSRYHLIGAASAILALTLASLSADAAFWNQPNPPSPADSRALPEGSMTLAQSTEGTAERFNRVEAQMRTLTGQIEEMTFQLRQLQEQLKRMQEDNEFRFRELEGGGGSPGPRSEGPADTTMTADSEMPVLPPPIGSGDGDGIGAMVEQDPLANLDFGGAGAPPQPLGTLTLDAPPASADQPLDLTAPLSQGDADVAMLAPTGDPRTDYERAYGSILNGDYGNAEAAFRQFMATYPDDPLAPDAQYWLGESLFVRALFRDAANEFLGGYKAYPNSGKAPDALLKLGLSLAGLGEREAACSTFAAVLKQYPKVSNAMRQRVKFEQSSANC